MRFATGWMVRGSNPGGGDIFLNLSRPSLGPTQPPIQWVLVLSREQSGLSVVLTTHPI